MTKASDKKDFPEIKIFLSSPGDVNEERVLADRVLNRLTDRYAPVAKLTPIIWEHEPLLATATFQDQIEKPSTTDIVICILWSRLGTRLPAHILREDGTRYDSGTEFEFEDAWQAMQRTGRPDLLVYRKMAEPFISLADSTDAEERLRQKRALDGFIQKWFHDQDGSLLAAFHGFGNSAEFEEAFEIHLDKLIQRRLEELGVDGLNLSDTTEVRKEALWEGSPFRGLKSFEFEHAPVFYGRTHAISGVLETLRTQAANGQAFVLVLGRSGGGKSSLVRAGVMPLLVEPGVVEGVGLWRRAIFRPSEASGSLNEAFAAALTSPDALPELLSDGTTVKELADLLGSTSKGADLLLKGALSQAAQKSTLETIEVFDAANTDLSAQERAQKHREILDSPPQAKLALLVDQLEELFTDTSIPQSEREAFIEAIAALAASGRVYVVATLRSDFYQNAMELPAFSRLKGSNGQYDVSAPTPAEIGQIIRLPAWRAGLSFEEHPQTGARLDDDLRDAAVSEPDSLPLLGFTLEELYNARSPSGLLTWEAYDALGGLAGALGRRAEETFQNLPKAAQDAMPQVMRQVVHVKLDRDQAATKRAASMDNFPADTPARQLVDAFVNARLFVVGGDSAGNSVVTLTHETLLTSWPRLQQWQADDQDFLRIRARVTFAAERWEEANRESQLLLPTGPALDEAKVMTKDDGMTLSPSISNFISQSLARSTRARRLKQSAVAALAVLTIAASGAAWYADGQRREAASARILSEQAKQEAEQNAASAQARLGELFFEQGRQALLNGRAEEATLLLGAAYSNTPQDRTGVLFSTARDLASIKGDSTLEHSGQITAIASGPDTLIAIAADDGSITVQRRDTNERLAKHDGDEDAIPALTFSPDGRYIAAGSDSGKILLWDLNANSKQYLNGHFQAITHLLFSQNGDQLASLSHDKTTRIWMVANGQEVATLAESKGTPVSAMFETEGNGVTTVTNEGDVTQWDSATGHSRNRCNANPSAPVRDALLLDPNNVVLALGKAGSVQVKVGATCDTQWGNTQTALGVSKTPQGDQLLVRNEQQITMIDTASGDTKSVLDISDLTSDKVQIIATALSSDSGLMGILDDQGTLTLADTAGAGIMARLNGHASSGSALTFASDSNSLTTGAVDGTIRQWNVSALRPCLLPGTNGRVVAFSPTGDQIVSGDTTGQITIAQPQDCSSAKVIPADPNGEWIQAIDYNSDGSKIAVVSGRTVTLLDAKSHETLWRHDIASDKFATSVAFTHDENGLFVGTRLRKLGQNKGGWIELDIAQGELRKQSAGFDFSVREIDFWNKNTYVITRTRFGLDLWWRDTGLRRHRISYSKTRAFAFWPSRTRISVGNTDGEIRVIRHTGSELFRFDAHSAPVTALAMKADSTLLASGANDGTAALWNPDKGTLVAKLNGHSGKVSAIKFVPNSSYVLSAATDGSVIMWDTTSGSQIAKFDGPAGPNPMLDVSPDGGWFAVSVGRGKTRLWTLPKVNVTPDAIATEISAVTPWGLKTDDDLPQDRWQTLALEALASKQIDTDAKGINLEQRRRLEEGRIAAKRGDALSAGLSWNQIGSDGSAPDQPDLSAAYQHAMNANLVTLNGMETVLTEHKDRVERVIFSKDGRFLASTDWSQKLVVWNTNDWSKKFMFSEGFGSHLSFSPDSTALLGQAILGGLVVIDLETGSETLRLPTGRKGVWSPDGTRIAAFNRLGAPIIYNAKTGAEMARFSGYNTTSRGFSISTDFTQIAAPNDAGVALIDTISRDVKHTLTAPKDAKTGKPLASIFTRFSPDGSLVAVIWSDQTGALFSTTDGQSKTPLPKDVSAVEFSKDGGTLIADRADAVVTLMNVSDGTALANVSGESGNMSSFAMQDTLFVTNEGTRRTVSVFDATTGAPVTEFRGNSTAWAQIAVSPDGAQWITTSGDGALRVWRQNPTAPLQTQPTSSDADAPPADVLATHQDGQRVVSQEDGSVLLFDTSDNSKKLSGHRGAVSSAQFTPDGEHVLTGGEDGNILVWDTTSSSLMTSITNACSDTVSSLLPTPDFSAIWAQCANGSLRLFETAKGRLMLMQFAKPAPKGKRAGMALSPDGKSLTLHGPDGPYKWQIKN